MILLQGENGRKLIENNLKQAGFQICLIECYKRVSKVLNEELEAQKWHSYRINTFIITSGEILYHFNNIISNLDQKKWFLQCKIIVVSTRLSKIAQKLGWRDIVVSHYANNKFLIEKIKQMYFNN